MRSYDALFSCSIRTSLCGKMLYSFSQKNLHGFLLMVGTCLSRLHGSRVLYNTASEVPMDKRLVCSSPISHLVTYLFCEPCQLSTSIGKSTKNGLRVTCITNEKAPSRKFILKIKLWSEHYIHAKLPNDCSYFTQHACLGSRKFLLSSYFMQNVVTTNNR